jgi:hypothetical protein
MRILHSSAQVARGIAIGGSTQGRPAQNGGTFASLRKEAEGKPADVEKEVKADAQTSFEARKAAIQNDEQSGKAQLHNTSTPSAPTTSAGARTQAIKEDKQVAAAPTSAATSHEARSNTIQSDHQSSADVPSWKELGQRIEADRKLKASKPSVSAVQKASTTSQAHSIDSIPKWSVGRYGVQRSFAFDSAVRARMFLMGASSHLLSESGWAGSVALNKTTSGNETVEIRLAGSQDGRDATAESGLSEHDIAVAEALDQLYSSPSASRNRRTTAFEQDAVKDSSDSPTSSVLRQGSEESHSPIDEHVPVHVSHQHSPRSQDSSPTQEVLSATNSRYDSKPIEEYVPVPNLHQQPKREFATLMGSTSSTRTLSSIRSPGLAGIIAARSSALNGLSSSSPAERRRLVATWTGANVNASQRVWSGIVQQGAGKGRAALRIDDFVPVHIDATQMGKRLDS